MSIYIYIYIRHAVPRPKRILPRPRCTRAYVFFAAKNSVSTERHAIGAIAASPPISDTRAPASLRETCERHASPTANYFIFNFWFRVWKRGDTYVESSSSTRIFFLHCHKRSMNLTRYIKNLQLYSRSSIAKRKLKKKENYIS